MTTTSIDDRPTASAGVLVWGLLATIYLLNVVMPNAFKVISASSIALMAAYYVILFGVRAFSGKYFLFLFASYPVTLFFIIVGQIHGASSVAAFEVGIVYMLFPLLWGVVGSGLVKTINLRQVVNSLSLAIPVSALLVAYFFWAFYNLGPEATEFLSDTSNPNARMNAEVSSEGYTAAQMHVFGSLIFLIGGLMASPGVIKNVLLRLLVIILSLVVALTSGRSFLILSFFMGIAISILVGLVKSYQAERLGRGLIIAFATGCLSLIILTLVMIVGNEYFNLNFSVAIEKLFDKLLNKGGGGRDEQFDALLRAIGDNLGLGMGHGTRVYWYSDEEKPWRYELMWLATTFRVGILGALVYAAPFFYTLWKTGRWLLRGELDAYEVFLFGGFFCAFLASNTNPYIESFVFQWMYILPMVYFMNRESLLGDQA